MLWHGRNFPIPIENINTFVCTDSISVNTASMAMDKGGILNVIYKPFVGHMKHAPPIFREIRGSSMAQSIPSDLQSSQFGDCRSSSLDFIAWLPQHSANLDVAFHCYPHWTSRFSR